MNKNRTVLLMLILLLSFGLLSSSFVIAKDIEVLKVSTGQSQLLKVVDLKRVAVTKPQVADIVTISNEEILINGKKEGKTTIHIWDKKGHRVYQVKIIDDQKPVINQIKELIDMETVKVAKVEETIILSGTVEDQNQLAKAKKIAGVFGEKVVDQLKVSNSLQILLEAQVFEINKVASKNLGFDWYSVDAEGVSLGSGTAVFGETSKPRFGLGYYERLSDLRTSLKALIQDNKAKLLAKPKIVTKSGKEANFSVGGEIPIVTTDGSGEQTVTWKKYGVEFKVKPTVTKTGKLDTYLHPKVSRLDWANAVEYGSGRLPAIKSSEVSTEVVIPDGSTLAIGGLIQQYRSKDIKELPFLGQIPMLGALFRSESFRENKSELIILVRPKIISSSAENKEEINMDNTLQEKKVMGEDLEKGNSQEEDSEDSQKRGE
jgi:pilus assembly protein CpaC